MSKMNKKVMPAMKLSGLESFNVTPEVGFVNIGERTNVTGSKAFARMILNGQFDEALDAIRSIREDAFRMGKIFRRLRKRPGIPVGGKADDLHAVRNIPGDFECTLPD
jgi:hypothetical protein